MNKNLITFENKLIKVLLKNVYKKIDVEITYQFANPYQLITKELKILKNSKHEISSSDLRNLNYYSLRKKGILLINNLVNIDRKYFNKKTNNMSYLSIPEKKLENKIKKRQIKTRSILLAAYAYLYVNYQLKSKYKNLYSQLNCLVYLKAKNFSLLQKWRLKQERKLWVQSKVKSKIMSRGDVLNFMQTYQRITQNMFRNMPKYASVIFNLNSNHQIKSAVYKKK